MPRQVPVHVFGLMGATETGFYKPCADWWALYADDFNGDIREIDCEASFFVGDAGGRLRGDTTNPWQDVSVVNPIWIGKELFKVYELT